MFHRNVLLLEYHIKNCGQFCLISIYVSSVKTDIMKSRHLAKNGKKESILSEFQKKEGLETKNMIPPKSAEFRHILVLLRQREQVQSIHAKAIGFYSSYGVRTLSLLRMYPAEFKCV